MTLSPWKTRSPTSPICAGRPSTRPRARCRPRDRAVRVGQHVCSGGDAIRARLGLPIHDAQFPAVAATPVRRVPARDPVPPPARHLAAWTGPARRCRGERVEGMRHGGQGRDAFRTPAGPWWSSTRTGRSGRSRRPPQVSAAPTARSSSAAAASLPRHRSLGCETGDDVVGVRVDGGVRQPDQPRGSGRSDERQRGQIRMQLVRGLDVPARDRPLAIRCPADAVGRARRRSAPTDRVSATMTACPASNAPGEVDDGVHVVARSHEPTATHLAPAGESVTRAASAAYEMVVVPVWSAEYPGRRSWRQLTGSGRGRSREGRRRQQGISLHLHRWWEVPPRNARSMCGRLSSRHHLWQGEPVMPMHAATGGPHYRIARRALLVDRPPTRSLFVGPGTQGVDRRRGTM